ncbi:MAG TPA: sigma-70 family RNA polymerase sigma factor [Gemmataceae bacterium]|nr:sigma-70 family RNA polymerase sigma factor [Gemmataceae bacterium]
MPHNQSFDDMMARLRVGDNDAAAQVFNRFANRLIELARRRLDPQIRQKLDPEDVLQSVFRSFFAHQAGGEITGLESWDNLWAWLVVITMRKCGRRIEYFHSASRDVQREIAIPPSDDDASGDSGTSSDEPTPSEAAILTETVEQLMSSLEGRHREILALSLQGYTAAEISSKVGCTERTAFRVLRRVKEMLEEMRVEADRES